MYNYNKLTEQGIQHIISITDKKRVFIGDEILPEYSHDEMPEYGIFKPDIYVEVLNKEEVSQIMKYSYENLIPVVARGAGTGLAGGATCKHGGIMISLMKMNKIYPVDTINMTITAEAGALLTDVADASAAVSLFYPPDPGERTASIGGTVITNAGGMRAVKYGVTRDYVRSIEAVLPNGDIVNFSSNVVKNTTGYDLKDLVIGSEGTLCICTKVTLKLIPAPKFSYTLVIPFNEIDKCVETVPKILGLPFVPTAVEFVEKDLLDIVRTRLNKYFPDVSGTSYLIVMYDSSSKEELEKACDIAAQTCLDAGAIDVKIADSVERIGSVWSVRAAALEGMKADSDSQEECDVVVPKSEIATFVKTAKKIGAKYNIKVVTVGHAGDGNIHTELLRKNLSDEEWSKNAHACLKELYKTSKQLGGQLSGEHGIGIGRLQYLEEFVGTPIYNLFKAIKIAFDPKNILNPGKLVSLIEDKSEEVL